MSFTPALAAFFGNLTPVFADLPGSRYRAQRAYATLDVEQLLEVAAGQESEVERRHP